MLAEVSYVAIEIVDVDVTAGTELDAMTIGEVVDSTSAGVEISVAAGKADDSSGS